MPPHEEFDQHHPKQAGEGQDKGNQVHKKADANELPDIGGHEEFSDFREGDQP
jgi:hypothetical protein